MSTFLLYEKIFAYNWKFLDMVNPSECLTSVYQNPSSKNEEKEVINQLLFVMWEISKTSQLLWWCYKDVIWSKAVISNYKAFLICQVPSTLFAVATPLCTLEIEALWVNDLNCSQRRGEMRYEKTAVRECVGFMFKCRWSWKRKDKRTLMKLETS